MAFAEKSTLPYEQMQEEMHEEMHEEMQPTFSREMVIAAITAGSDAPETFQIQVGQKSFINVIGYGRIEDMKEKDA